MANNQIQTYADMVNLQVAAEAFWDRLSSPVVLTSTDILTDGNKNNSKEPTAIADLFKSSTNAAPRYKLIAHQDLSLNATTVSELGTAAVQNKSGFSASVFLDTTTGQYTLSIRSTEFADSIKDAGDVLADAAEIGGSGWAFGQINSMESFWSSIVNGSASNGINATTIPDAAALATFRSYLTEGVGKVNVTGYSLGGNLAEAFTELHRTQVNKTYLFNGAGTGVPLVGGGFVELWQTYKAAYDAAAAAQPGGPIAYSSIYDSNYHAAGMLAIAGKVRGAGLASSPLGTTSSAPRTADSQIVDLFASNYSGSDIIDTATARSGQRHGTSRAIWYEDQPVSTWSNGDFSQWDWGQGHSIVLLQDSLNLMAAFERLDPSITEDKLAVLFQASSAKNHDSLEKALDALGKLVGLNTPVAAATADSQYAQMDLRNLFHERLKAIQDTQAFKDLAGQLLIRPASADLRAAARNDFGAVVALQDLSTIWITGKDAAGDAKLEVVWQSTRASDYTAWQADKSSATPTTFTDQWITDRAALLQALVSRNKQDNSTGLIYDVAAPPGRALAFQFYETGNTQQQTLFLQRQGGVVSKEQRIVFGNDGNNAITGSDINQLGDHLYGGAGDDVVNGFKGDDYLEGNDGADMLDGGEGNDTLIGGKDNDTYVFQGGWGKDTIIDSDGLGILKVDGSTITTAKAAGQRNVWVAELDSGEKVGMSVYDNASSSTGKNLVITRAGSTDNIITIKDFGFVSKICGRDGAREVCQVRDTGRVQ